MFCPRSDQAHRRVFILHRTSICHVASLSWASFPDHCDTEHRISECKDHTAWGHAWEKTLTFFFSLLILESHLQRGKVLQTSVCGCCGLGAGRRRAVVDAKFWLPDSQQCVATTLVFIWLNKGPQPRPISSAFHCYKAFWVPFWGYLDAGFQVGWLKMLLLPGSLALYDTSSQILSVA